MISTGLCSYAGRHALFIGQKLIRVHLDIRRNVAEVVPVLAAEFIIFILTVLAVVEGNRLLCRECQAMRDWVNTVARTDVVANEVDLARKER